MENNEIKKGLFNNKYKGILIVLLVLIIACFSGYFIYSSVFQEENTDPPTEEEDDSEVGREIIIVSSDEYDVDTKATYKSKNEENELTIIPQSDEETYKKAVSEGNEKDLESYNAFAYYNGKLLAVSAFKNGNYIVYYGDDIKEKQECYQYGFVVDDETKTLLDLDTNLTHNVYKIGNKYYIIDSTCVGGEKFVYNDNLEKIGTNYLGVDKKNFYILNGNIIKYDVDGKEDSKTSEVFKTDDANGFIDGNNYMTCEYQGVLYILIKDTENIYLIDTRDLKINIIGTSEEYAFNSDDILIEEGDNKLIISLHDSKNTDTTIKKTYDVNTKTIN